MGCVCGGEWGYGVWLVERILRLIKTVIPDFSGSVA